MSLRKYGGLRRVGACATAVVTSLAVAGSLMPVTALGAVIKYDLPTTPTSLTHVATDAQGNEYEYRHLTTAASMFAEFNVEMLGIDSITSNPKTVVGTWDAAQSQAKAGILASNANINPDEFLSNYYYNIYAAENPSLGLLPASDDATVQIQSWDWSTISADHDNLPYGVYYGADILYPTSASNATTYLSYIETKNAGLGADDAEYYDPEICVSGTGTIATMVDGEYRLANSADKVILKNQDDQGHFTVQSRYAEGASTYEVADTFAQAAYASQYAVLKAIAEGKTTKKTVAVVADYDSTSQTYKLQNLDVNMTEVRGTGCAGHIAAGIQNTANDLCDSLGAVDDGTEQYVSDVTAEQLAQADYVLFSDYFSDTQYSNSQQLGKEEAVTLLKQAMGADAEGRILANYPGLVFNFLYASSSESIFNPFIAQAFVYSDVLNFTDMMAYWYNKVNHIAVDSLQDMIDTLCANASLPKGLSAIGTVSEKGIETIQTQFDEGVAYYQANKDALVSAAPALEWPSSTAFGVGRTKVATQTYTGGALEPAVTVYSITGEKISANNYTVSYADNTQVGRASVTVTGKDGTDYAGQSFTTYFMIGDKVLTDLSGATVTPERSSYTYTGSVITPAVTVQVDGKTLTNADYDVAYSGNLNAGTATITVTGKGDYTGTATASFSITKAAVDMSGVTFAGKTVTYNGKAQALAATGVPQGVSVSYEGNGQVNAGTYTVTARFTADANHEPVPSMTATLTIAKATNKLTVKKAAKSYKAKKRTGKLAKKKSFAIGAKAKTKVTYTLSAKAKRAGVKVSKAGKVTLKKGTKKGTYKITVKAAGNGNYKAAASKVVKVTVK